MRHPVGQMSTLGFLPFHEGEAPGMHGQAERGCVWSGIRCSEAQRGTLRVRMHGAVVACGGGCHAVAVHDHVNTAMRSNTAMKCSSRKPCPEPPLESKSGCMKRRLCHVALRDYVLGLPLVRHNFWVFFTHLHPSPLKQI